MFRKPQKIRGYVVPRRRFTLWAAAYFLAFVCLPVLGLALAAEAVLYLTVDKAFDTCLSILCWVR